MITLVFDQPYPMGPRVIRDGVQIPEVVSIELLPLRECIVRHHRLPLEILDGEVVCDVTRQEQYEVQTVGPAA